MVDATEAQAIAQEAYIYLYPLILMDLTRKQLINLDPKVSPMGGPANAFTHIRAFPTADMRAVVRPNFDTLYSSAWLDLTSGPVVVSTADTDGRYFMLPMLDMWSDVFAVPGKRTNGTGAASFAVVPPGWSGQLPADVGRLDAPTSFVWIIGRTQTNGVKDYDAVHKVQDGYRVTLLADWGKTPSVVKQAIDPAVDTKTEPLRQINGMAPVDYFKRGAELMKLNPPHLTDWSTVARLRRIGIEPGKSFDASKATPAVLARAAAAGLNLKRAIVARLGVGANQVEDAIYPLNVSAADGKPVTGGSKYVLHFTKDELPPVDAFWSLTLYDEEGFQVANPLNRFATGDRDALKFGADGSLDLYVQNDHPAPDKEPNWLPSPKSGVLALTLRLYAPKLEVADGWWNPPAMKRAN